MISTESALAYLSKLEAEQTPSDTPEATQALPKNFDAVIETENSQAIRVASISIQNGGSQREQP